jgi:hypothetical protein
MTSSMSLVLANGSANLINEFFSLQCFSLVSSLTPPCCPYTTSKGEGGKYPKQVSKGDLLVEVWTALL